MDEPKPLISVEVAYALPELQKIVPLQVEQGCTALDAAKQSNITRFFPGLDLDNSKMGVFGKAIKASTHILADGERVEIYRPLVADPKDVRKARAAKAKAARA